MTAVCKEVKKIKVVRIQDARPRRFPFQKKIGAGGTVEEFEELGRARTASLEASAGLMTMMDIPLVHAYRAFKPPKLLKLD